MQAYLQGLPLHTPQYDSHCKVNDPNVSQLPVMTPEYAEKAIQQLMNNPEAARPNKSATPSAATPSRSPLTYCKGVVFPKVYRKLLEQTRL